MAWNEPGGNGRDPWNQGRRSGGQVPDLDEMLARLRSRFRGRGPGGNGLPTGSLGLVVALIALLWAAFGFYVVDEQERAVVLRFGDYDRTDLPGLRWHMPFPVETVEKVNVTKVRQVSEQADMLTRDENIIHVELKVQYRINSAEDYLFSLQDPDNTLRHVTRSAVREVVGRSKMDFILTEGRQDVSARTKNIVQERLDAYESGLQVTELNLQDIQAPEPVQGAFADVIKAREDQVRLKNEAEAYANDRLPKARGQAARETAEATAYRDRLIASAEGEADRFSQLLAEYKKAPQVTRDRLYFETMSEVLAGVTKVIVDVDENGPMIYLPLEQLRQMGKGSDPGTDAANPSGTRPSHSPDSNFRSRDRGGRR